MKLTKRAVEKIGPAEKDILVWDTTLPSFGLRIKPSGNRSYLVQYRNQLGRSRRLTIGQHGVLTVDMARKKALQILSDVAHDRDPAEVKHQKQFAPKMSDLIDRYLREHAMSISSRKP